MRRRSLEPQKKISNWISYYPRPSEFVHGGVNESRVRWADAISKELGIRVTLLDAGKGYISRKTANTDRVLTPHLGGKRFSMLPVNLRHFKFGKETVLQLHEGWTLSNLYVATICVLTSTRYVITPHGVCDPNIVSHLRGGKIRRFVESWVLTRATRVHLFFSSEEEYVHLIAPKAKTVIAPTGVDELVQRFLWEGGGGFGLFVGRIDIRHKGLDLLVRAINKSQIDLDFIFVGPDFFGGREEISALIKELELEDKVKIISEQNSFVISELMRT